MPSEPALTVRPYPHDGVTFTVDAVGAARERLWTEPLHVSLARRFRRKILVLPEADKAVINSAYSMWPNHLKVDAPIQKIGARCHPLIDAVHTAFSLHFPLTVSPDSIWLTIAQGFSHHLGANAEKFRSRLVRHQGRRTLKVPVFDLTLESFEGAIGDFSRQIRDASDPVLHQTLLCDFSTSTQGTRTASEVVLMDGYSSYFEYEMECICGIPKIMVTGTPEDWQRIRARVEVLETYGLGWWVARLRPILDEFIQTVSGRINLEFWQAIYKPKKAYGGETVTGWIADLFPYLGDAPNRARNHIFQYPREGWAIPVDKGVKTSFPSRVAALLGFRTGSPSRAGELRSVKMNSQPGFEEMVARGREAGKGVSDDCFPSGLSSVRLQVTFPDRSTRELDLVAGYFAVEQSPDDLSLSPVIGWSVTEPRPETPVRI